MQHGIASRRRVRVRAYRAGRAMTANGRQVQPGDLILGGHRVPNLAECLQLGYMIPVEEAELSDEEREAVEQEEQDHIALQKQRMEEENPDLQVARLGSTPGEIEMPDGTPDVILQDSGRRTELEAGAAVVEQARRVSEQDRRPARRSGDVAEKPQSAPAPAADDLDEDDEAALQAGLARQAREEAVPESKRGGTASKPSGGAGGQGSHGSGSSGPRKS